MKRIAYLFLTILLWPILSAAMPAPGQHDTPPVYPPPPVEGEVIPLFITGYNWNPEVDSMGCDHDCSVTAIGFPTEDRFLGMVAACPAAWVHLDIVRVVTIEGVGSFWCVDVLGSPEYRVMRWVVGSGWVYHVDLALVDPYSAPFGLAYNYELQWSFVYEVGCYSCIGR